MKLPFTDFWPKLKSRSFHFAAIPLFLISLPCLSSASVLEGKLRETMDEVTCRVFPLPVFLRES
jgi:hypothetical protein